ncbi:hypothetical protein D3C86_1905230 [compost metagenome]
MQQTEPDQRTGGHGKTRGQAEVAHAFAHPPDRDNVRGHRRKGGAGHAEANPEQHPQEQKRKNASCPVIAGYRSYGDGQTQEDQQIAAAFLHSFAGEQPGGDSAQCKQAGHKTDLHR